MIYLKDLWRKDKISRKEFFVRTGILGILGLAAYFIYYFFFRDEALAFYIFVLSLVLLVALSTSLAKKRARDIGVEPTWVGLRFIPIPLF
ncbi:MAG: hypothetical protein G01um1014107_122, partial [Parcubacteria group bacterium Gr01-1014_107]